MTKRGKRDWAERDAHLLELKWAALCWINIEFQAGDLARALRRAEKRNKRELTAPEVATILVQMTNGVMWKEPDADGNIARFTKRLNDVLAERQP